MRRDKLEIYMEILKAIDMEKTAKPTRIMYKAGLLWSLINEILDALLKNGLIKVIQYGKKKRYCLTNEGERVLKILETAHQETLKITRMRKKEQEERP